MKIFLISFFSYFSYHRKHTTTHRISLKFITPDLIIMMITLLVLMHYVQSSVLNQYDTVSRQIVDNRSMIEADNEEVVLSVFIIKIYVIYIMDSEQVKVSPSEKTKLYLTKKLSEIETKLKRMKKKKIIIQTIGSILSLVL